MSGTSAISRRSGWWSGKNVAVSQRFLFPFFLFRFFLFRFFLSSFTFLPSRSSSFYPAVKAKMGDRAAGKSCLKGKYATLSEIEGSRPRGLPAISTQKELLGKYHP